MHGKNIMTDTQTNAPVVAVITRLTNAGDVEIAAFTKWLVNLGLTGAEYPGFWNNEIITPDKSEHHEWILVQRYRTAEQASAWGKSETRLRLLADLATAVPDGAQVQISEEIGTYGPHGNVATAIVTDVKPGMEKAYWAWERKIQAAQAKFPGYAGACLQPPLPGRAGQWTTLLRFHDPESLDNWCASEERAMLLEEAKQFVYSKQFTRLTSSFPGWFEADEETAQKPGKWKTAILVLLGLFPIIMFQKRYCNPLMVSLNQSLSTVINTVVSVSIVTYITMPILIRLFRWWLFPRPGRKGTDALGLAASACLLLLEVALLWNIIQM
jgi:antibiotic biosynthesis monooxygenase (ABM) superfamily enzyme